MRRINEFADRIREAHGHEGQAQVSTIPADVGSILIVEHMLQHHPQYTDMWVNWVMTELDDDGYNMYDEDIAELTAPLGVLTIQKAKTILRNVAIQCRTEIDEEQEW